MGTEFIINRVEGVSISDTLIKCSNIIPNSDLT